MCRLLITNCFVSLFITVFTPTDLSCLIAPKVSIVQASPTRHNKLMSNLFACQYMNTHTNKQCANGVSEQVN